MARTARTRRTAAHATDDRPRRVAIYIRRSTDEEHQPFSLEAQETKLVLTSRVVPTGLDDRVLVEPVHALARDEAVLLARELPHLGRLLHLDTPAVHPPDPAVEADRATVTEVLRLVQGHPKLLELADAAAVDRATLDKHLAAARATAGQRGTALATFFTRGESSLDAEGFLDALTAWTTSITETLPDEARLLLQFLCLLEDGDRTLQVVDGNWADLWRRLERPGETPDLASAQSPLVTAALVHPEPVRVHSDGDQPPVRYAIHPGVAEAVRSTAPDQLRPAVDTELAAWWYTVFDQARTRESGEHTGAVVHAGLAAVPYLLRLHAWNTAVALLERPAGAGRVRGRHRSLRPHAGPGPGAGGRGAAGERHLRPE